jgi:hypothetical protein
MSHWGGAGLQGRQVGGWRMPGLMRADKADGTEVRTGASHGTGTGHLLGRL